MWSKMVLRLLDNITEIHKEAVLLHDKPSPSLYTCQNGSGLILNFLLCSTLEQGPFDEFLNNKITKAATRLPLASRLSDTAGGQLKIRDEV